MLTSASQEWKDEVFLPSLFCLLEAILLLVIDGIDVCTKLQEVTNAVHKPLEAGNVEGGLVVGLAPHVRVNPMHQQEVHNLQLVILYARETLAVTST